MNDGKPDLTIMSNWDPAWAEARIAALESENTALREIERRATEYVREKEREPYAMWSDVIAAYTALANAIRRTHPNPAGHVSAERGA